MSVPATTSDLSEQAHQLTLSLPHTVSAHTRSAFVRTDANEVGWRAGLAWLASTETILVVCGPAGSGKTHFAHALLEENEHLSVTASVFPEHVERLTSTPEMFVHIDDMPADGDSLFDPREFLTALETGLHAGKRFVLSGREHPAVWSHGLKDLKTRLEAAPRASLAEPDEALIRLVIAKGFHDRQIKIEPAVIEYAVPRLPRTFAAAHGFVAMADQLALEQKRKITAPFVQKLLEHLSERDSTA